MLPMRRARTPLLITFALAALPYLFAQQLTPSYEAPSTREMAEVLRSIYDHTDWKADPNKPAQRADYYRQLLAHDLPLDKEIPVRIELGNELLRVGDSEAAVDTFESVVKLGKNRGLHFPAELDRSLHENLALAYLRLGEQENCLTHHAAASCIFPIRGSGVHTIRRGAEGAVREYTALLAAKPDDNLARWLLNIAYMQLGEYPAKVPHAWLIPEDRFRSDAPFPAWEDIAMSTNIHAMNHAGGVAVQDFDGDGLLDIMLSSSGPLDQLRFYHNNGDGTFSDRTAAAGLIGETGGLNLVATDYNNDGRPDILILRGGWWHQFGDYPVSLLRNNGDGTFDDVTRAAGLLTFGPTQTAAWADYDNDGWLDLFLGHESEPGQPWRSQLFHNNRDGTFTEVGAENGLADLGYVKGVAWGDYNNDGRPDLYISTRDGHNRLFRNDGPADPAHPDPAHWRFTDVTAQAHVQGPAHSFATWFFDYDNDGWPDLFVAGYGITSEEDVGAFELGHANDAQLPRLYRNNRDGTFTDVTHRVHLDRAILTMGSSFGDLDSDGWLDVYLGNGDPDYRTLLPNRMFRNRNGDKFEDVTTAGGFGNLQKGHGVAFADFENSGRVDVFEEMGGALPGDLFMSSLYRNPGNGNHWITLILEGTRSNRPAFGARIDVRFRENGVERHVYRTIGYGASFGGNPWREPIGLGSATSVESVEVRWPSGAVQHFDTPAVDRFYRLREGSASAELLNLSTFRFAASAPEKAPMSQVGTILSNRP
ncbi:FG-GAP-like repeat-containing protein [Silvibacterium sp.]|uniref:FG-GAP-like repeat-containing protein n=1 Tax=Silvibacterium sp. TaxID=1964179 RepID=UPI0039E5DC3D